MDQIQKVAPLGIALLKRVVSLCFSDSVPNPDEIAEKIDAEKVTLCITPFCGLWIFSKESHYFRIEAVQGVRMCNREMLTEIESIARQNECDILWCQTKRSDMGHLLMRLGFSVFHSDGEYVEFIRMVKNADGSQTNQG